MTDFSALLTADRGQSARPLHIVDKGGFEAWLKQRSAEDRALLKAQRFDGKNADRLAILARGAEFEAVLAVRDCTQLSPWCLAAAAEALPDGTYKLEGAELGRAGLGWLLAQHKFDSYASKKNDADRGPRVLVTGEPARIDEAVRLANATALVRDLVNTPAADLGPAEFECLAKELAARGNAKVHVTSGAALNEGYPLIAAVGAAATDERAPRLIEVHWGKSSDPKIAIVGKGVCFDSGGLDLKQPAWMRNMKKDMGGGAHALALAHLIVEARLPVHLHLLIPAVENSVAGAAYRPGDIVKSRKGLTVEIDNTDAEGRLILADALTKAAEGKPELIIDFATLTGAARAALGPDLPATFVNRDDLADTLSRCAADVGDPLWRMPLWDPYDDDLKSGIADLSNTSGNAMAGAVYAALFLRRFVPDDVPWAHLDTYAWRDAAKPGRPKGGEALGLRAVFAALEARYSVG